MTNLQNLTDHLRSYQLIRTTNLDQPSAIALWLLENHG